MRELRDRSQAKTKQDNQKVIDSVPSYQYVKVNEAEPNRDLDCSICLDSVADGEKVKKLPCGHIFHAEHVDEWLGHSLKCPNCRYFLKA